MQTEGEPRIESTWLENRLCRAIPFIKSGLTEEESENQIRDLLSAFLVDNQIKNYVCWYYTPMALAFSDQLKPQMIVYDCMDELSAFKFAPPRLKQLEKQLFNSADLVFTGGISLYQHKKDQHHNIHPFPSSIDKEHFATAREEQVDPIDQTSIPHPRIGFYGVVDERFDIELLGKVAFEKPSWQFIILGPIVKINPDDLPKNKNIHYLGSKTYNELPNYMAGWDIAFIPFARNESTRFISPTKTPEFLAAGKPVISTSIADVVDPYGTNNLVSIADEPEDFIRAAEAILSREEHDGWLNRVDHFLQNNSWDKTWSAMMQLMQKTLKEKLNVNTKKNKEAYV